MSTPQPPDGGPGDGVEGLSCGISRMADTRWTFDGQMLEIRREGPRPNR